MPIIFDSQKRKVITNQSDSDSSRNKPHTTISGKHLYKSYLHYINNIPSLNNKSTYCFVHKYPTRSVSVIGRYTNDLVDKNYEKNKLKEYFIEFNKINCQYKDCTHTNERECKVKELVSNNKIMKSRYENYINIVRNL